MWGERKTMIRKLRTVRINLNRKAEEKYLSLSLGFLVTSRITTELKPTSEKTVRIAARLVK